MKQSHTRSRGSIAALLGLSVASVLTVSTSVDAAAPPPVHGQVVPDTPRTKWPRITDGSVNGGDRVAQYIVYGGSFTSITQPDGTVSNQPYLVALDIDTGKMSTTFRPVLDGQVRVIEAGDTPGTVFVGGRFKNVNGVYTGGLVKLDVFTGQRVASFSAPFNGEVSTLARTGNRLFVGGFFTAVGNSARSQLAEVAASTGAVNANFTIGVTGLRDSGCRSDGFCYTVGGPPVRSVRVNPAGTRLAVMHRGDLVGGLQRWGAAIIDISTATPTVTSFRANLWDPAQNNGRTDFVGVVDGDMTPDGSMIVMANGIGNFPPLHDTVTAFPVNGGDAVQPLWVNQNFDSNFAVAASDQAVYQGGHFCWVESQSSTASPLYWPGSAGNQYSCEATSGSVFQPRTTYRYHVSAGDLSTGRAIAWDPGSNDSFRGVNLLRTIDRGLLLGHDGTRVKWINVGRAAFFDMGITKQVGEIAAPTISITNPVANQTLSIQTVLGSSTDDYRTKRVQLRMRDRATNQWIQADGSRGATAFIWEAALGVEGLPGTARDWSVSSLPSPTGSIQIQARAADFAGRQSAWVSVNVTGDVAGRAPAPAPVAQPIAAPEPAAVAAPVPDPGPQQSPWRWEGHGAAGIAQAPDGTVLRVDLDGGVSRRKDSQVWEKVPGLGTGWTGPIAAASGQEIAGAASGGSRRRGPGGDVPIAASGVKNISISADGTIGYIDTAGNLTFVERGTARADGAALGVAVQSNGTYWKVGTDGAVLRGRPGAWTVAGGGASGIAVSAKGEVAIVTSDGKVARYVADGNFQTVDGIPSAVASVTIQKGKIFALGADQNVYRLAEIVNMPADL